MNKTRKLASLLLALVMVLGMVGSAMAANITITGGVSGAEYSAWKLLDATDGGNGKFAYTVNGTYAAALKKVTEKDTDAAIVDYIADLDAEGIRKFANDIYAEIKDLAADAITTNDKFVGVDQGYWLIAETQTGSAADVYSLVMLDTAGKDDVSVNTKESWPTVDKQVQEKNDSTGETSWGDTADYDIGDKIEYKLIGTLPSQYANYVKYEYTFKDTLSNGLDYNGDAKVYVVNGNEKIDVTEQFAVTYKDKLLTITCGDLKAIKTVSASSSIVVEYSATLNENAVIGQTGNTNTVVLEFTNNPYIEGDGDEKDKGTTPPDTVIVFTYELDVNKVDKDGNALKGAGFTLYKKNKTTNQYEAVSSEVKGTDMTTFKFEGLDEGEYKLVESTVPAGYNKVADIEFKVVSTLDDKGEKLTGLMVTDSNGTEITDFKVTLESGLIATNVINQAGTELPSTGGMGTTLLYIAGSILVVGAFVLMITKRRVTEK